MSLNNNGTDPTVTVENEKQVITIGNSIATPAAPKPTISVEKEKEIIDEIEKHCSRWRLIGNIYIASIIIFGLAAVSTSVLVSIYTGSDESVIKVSTIKVMACISTISLAILTSFNLVSNSANARNAWKSLNAALMLYAAGSITIQQLIEQYQKGENQLGSFSFNYGSNSDKPGTYAHDIAASDEERKQKEADDLSKRQALAAMKNGKAGAEQLLN
ncbi:hypothetical protein [Segetibacter aerophilus]|uniref:SMODS and SLOG-associating 2TM effector domain-containing protein n=1 Tax=Segetibacter aerophilus TaxID=670293 RepID=A0A512BH50_9BACT|nr:hypothetical protein [Segetibacter aerophilus]GEO11294.1 hypothetical protein SAE01_37900 [Segetibacter aerophilus]